MIPIEWERFKKRWPIRVLNGSGEEIPPHSVVLISNCSVVDNELVFTVIKPNASSTQFNAGGYLVTSPLRIGSRSTDEGYASTANTPVLVRCNGSPSIGTIWGPKHGQFTLEQYYYGFGILSTSTTSAGNTVAAAQWVGVHNVLCKTDAQSTKGSGTITCSVWTGAVNSEADTGMDITGVGNQFASVAASKFVWLGYTGGSYYITQTEKTSQSLMSEIRIKSGNTHVEAEERAYFVDTVGTLAYDDKIELDDC